VIGPLDIVVDSAWYDPFSGWNTNAIDGLRIGHGIDLPDGGRLVRTIMGRPDRVGSADLRAAQPENEVPVPTTDGRWLVLSAWWVPALVSAVQAGHLAGIEIVDEDTAATLRAPGDPSA
jgi:hypothetical protein